MAGSSLTTVEDEASAAIALLPPARLGFLLGARRKQAGIGSRAAAQAAGIGLRALKDIESGRNPPDAGVLGALLECYGVPVGEFVPPRRPLVVSNPGASSGEILRGYVDAVRTWRHAGRKEKLNFRADDLHILSELLGTDPEEIERRLIALTGCSRAEARALRKWFLAALITIPVATAVMAPGVASAATMHPASAATHHRVASPSASAAHTKQSKTAVSGSAVRPHAGALNPVGISGAWNLKLDSEFTGTSLDTSIWQTGWFGSGTTGPVNATGEAACYSPNNVTFPGDGSVHLKVTQTQSTCDGMTKPDTGALLSSNPHDGRASGGFEFTHGVVEARVYVPASGGKVANWPAVWTDGQTWPTTGEDDIMEGMQGGQACFHFHSTEGAPGTCVAGSPTGWHTFASDWEPGSVTYYYDGVKVGQITTGITNSPMYLVLDNTVATGSSAKAADMRVAYVRVWQH